MTASPGWPGLPRRIRIGWRRYRVVRLSKRESSRLRGCTEATKGDISLDRHLTGELLVQTLLHEVLHAQADAYLGTTEAVDERTTDALAAGLVALMQDNPALVRWALATLEAG